MSKKQSVKFPADLPEDFFDSNKKSKKAQEDDLAKELEKFEQEMATLQEESEEQIKEEFEKLQDERSLDELDQQINQWKKIIELEKKAEELKNKTVDENPTKKLKISETKVELGSVMNPNNNFDDLELDDIEDFEDKLFDWRSKKL